MCPIIVTNICFQRKGLCVLWAGAGCGWVPNLKGMCLAEYICWWQISYMDKWHFVANYWASSFCEAWMRVGGHWSKCGEEPGLLQLHLASSPFGPFRTQVISSPLGPFLLWSLFWHFNDLFLSICLISSVKFLRIMNMLYFVFVIFFWLLTVAHSLFQSKVFVEQLILSQGTCSGLQSLAWK